MTLSSRFVSALLLLAVPTFVYANPRAIRFLLDVDHDTATGCLTRGVRGVDHVLTTTIAIEGGLARIAETTKQACVAGVMAGPIETVDGGSQATFNAASGVLALETRVPYSMFGSDGRIPRDVRIAFEATNGVAAQRVPAAVLSTVPSAKRRRAVGDERVIVMDGDLREWGTIPPFWQNAAAATSSGLDLRRVVAHADSRSAFLYLGVAATLFPTDPLADDDVYSRVVGADLVVSAPGVLSNDVDVFGFPLTAMVTLAPAHGDLALNGDGGFTYVADDPAASGEDAFEYAASNGERVSRVARVRVIAGTIANSAPVAGSDSFQTLEDTPLTVAAPGVLANDTDPDGQPLVVSLLTDVAHGTLTLNANGAFTYAAAANQHGTDTFSYSVTDGALTATAIVAIEIAPDNDPPVALGDASSTTQGAPATGSVLGNDADIDGDTLTAVLASNAGHGTVVLHNDGTFTYTPSPTFVGTDSFTYRANDGRALSEPATVTITVAPSANQAPSFSAGANVTVDEDSGPYAAPWATSINPGGPSESAQVLTFSVAKTNGNLFASGPSIAGDGQLTFTPAANASGTSTVTVTLRDDGFGSNTSAPAQFTITVSPVNDPPVAVDDAFAGFEDLFVGPTNAEGALSTVLQNDADADGNAMTAEIVVPPAQSDSFAFHTTGFFTFRAPKDFNGVLSFTYRITDGTSWSQPATVTVTFRPVNDPPGMTYPRQFEVDAEGGPFSQANWATNFSPGPPDESAQTVSLNPFPPGVVSPALFTVLPSLTPDGTLRFTPSGIQGRTVVQFSLEDNAGWENGGQAIGLHNTEISFNGRPRVQATSPSGGATGVARSADMVIDFDQSVYAGASAFRLECASGIVDATASGVPSRWTIDPVVDLPAGDACTVTIFAAQVTEADRTPARPMATDHTFTFTVTSP